MPPKKSQEKEYVGKVSTDLVSNFSGCKSTF